MILCRRCVFDCLLGNETGARRTTAGVTATTFCKIDNPFNGEIGLELFHDHIDFDTAVRRHNVECIFMLIVKERFGERVDHNIKEL